MLPVRWLLRLWRLRVADVCREPGPGLRRAGDRHADAPPMATAAAIPTRRRLWRWLRWRRLRLASATAATAATAIAATAIAAIGYRGFGYRGGYGYRASAAAIAAACGYRGGMRLSRRHRHRRRHGDRRRDRATAASAVSAAAAVASAWRHGPGRLRRRHARRLRAPDGPWRRRPLAADSAITSRDLIQAAGFRPAALRFRVCAAAARPHKARPRRRSTR